MPKQVPPGARGEAEQRVTFEHTLTYYDPDLPPVYSTPHMIGLMETAAYHALKPYCDEGGVSVGTAINIEHRAAALEGTLVKAEAELQAFDGRFYVFRVSAIGVNGASNVELGSGTVSRAIVNQSRLMARLQKQAER
jgi:predicted thioesterase